MRGGIVKLEKKVMATIDSFCTICLVFIMALVLAGVFGRFTGLFSLGWLDEILYFGLAWMIFGKTALLFRNQDHLKIELMDLLLADKIRVRNIHEILVNFLVLVCLILCFWGSVKLGLTKRISPILALPLQLWYFSICLSFGLMTLSAIFHLIKAIRRFAYSFRKENLHLPTK